MVTALNRGAQVREDGSFWLSQIPADVGLVRVRATCVRDGETVTGASPFFEPVEDAMSEVPDIVLDSPPLVPARLTLTAAVDELGPGESTQLLATADFPDGSSADVTAAIQGTSYTVSNPAIASVDAGGLVTGLTGGTALVSAFNEGALGVTVVRVAFAASEDSDGDGIPDAVEIALGLDPNDPLDAFRDLDGDGLANVDEVALGTGLDDPDSDDDGILDGEEVEVGVDGFVTNPLLADTDGDLLRDALELQIGTDPTDATSFDYGAALSDLTVAPTEILLARYLGDPPSELTRQLAVTGELIDGETIDLTSSSRGTTYASSDLLVCSFTSTDGEVLAGVDGSCEVTAALGAFSARVAIDVGTLPRTLATLGLPGFANDVAVDLQAGMAYVAAGSAGLLVIDVSDPSAPALVAAADTLGSALEVVAADGVAYVADHTGGLAVVDVSVPTSPSVLAAVATGGEARDLAVGDGLALVAAGSAGLAVVDVSDPAAPFLITLYDPPGLGAARAVARRPGDGLVALASLTGGATTVSILDLADPAVPQSLAAMPPTAGVPYGLEMLDDRLLLGGVLAGGENGLLEIDLIDPAAPAVLSTVPAAASGLPYDLAVDERHAHLADIFFTGTVPILDLSSPGVPTAAAYWRYNFVRGNGHGIAVADGLVFLAESATQSPFLSDGDSRLRIGQYVPRPVDTGGVAPTVAWNEPQAGAVLTGGRSIVVAADAADDVAVSSVTFFARDTGTGEEVLIGIDTTAPHALDWVLPAGPTTVELRAVARDSGGNLAEDSVTIEVLLNQPPSVTLTQPVEGTTFFEGDLIELAADASDADGTVAQVAFSINGSLVATDTTAPYRRSVVASLGEPTLLVEAVATDDLGAISAAQQATVSVIADPAPVVNILQPAAGVSAVAELPLTIEVEATDNEPLASVVVRVDGGEVFSSPDPPYRVTLDVPLNVSELLIEVTARDGDGQETTASRVVPVVPSDPPTVSLLAPVAGEATTVGFLLRIEASAADDVGVTSVELLVDSAVVATLSDPPYRFDFTVPAGSAALSVTARATDTASQVTLSEAVVVTVLASAPPTVTLTAPADGTTVVVGETVAVAADAADDVGVAEVRFLVDGALAASDATPPYGFDLTLAAAAGAIVELVAEAEDTDGQTSRSQPVALSVVAGDGTTIAGRVVDAAGDPVGGADVVCGEGATTSAGDGSFQVADLPVDEGDFVCRATATIGARSLIGRSAAVAPVPGGTADAGDIVARDVVLVAAGDELQLLDTATGSSQPLYTLPDPDEEPAALAVRDDGFVLLVGSSGVLQIVDTDRARVVGDMGIAWSPTASFGRVRLTSVAIHPSTGTVYGVADSTARLQRLESGGKLTELGFTGVEDESSLAFSPDGTLYQVGAFDATLQVLDPETGTPQLSVALARGYRALAIHPVTGVAYVATRDELSTLDLTTGIATPVAPLTLDSVIQMDFGTLSIDAGTTAIGTVVDSAGLPVAGATVSCAETIAASAADGSFAVVDLPSHLGSFRCRASHRDSSGERLRGSSQILAPVAAGTVDVGTLTLRPVGGALYPGLGFAADGTVVAVAAGDLDGDGLDDVVAALDSGRVAVLLATEPSLLGNAVRYRVGSSPVAVQVADLDGDGALDVATANRSSNDVSVLLGSGDGTLAAENRFAVGFGPRDLAVADFDLDGSPDLAVANTDSQDLSVLYGLGGGDFASEQRLVLSFAPGSLAAGDLSGDGRADLVLADVPAAAGGGLTSPEKGFSEALFTVFADSSGALQVGPTVPVCCTVIGATIADLDGDGHNDLIGKGLDVGDLIVVRGRGDGTFTGGMRFEVPAIDTELFFSDADLVVGDFRGDGRAGIAFVQSFETTILRGLPLGGVGARHHFPAPSAGGGSSGGGGGGVGGLTGGGLRGAKVAGGEGEVGGPTGSASGDFDGDGVDDLAVAADNEVVLYYGADSVEEPAACDRGKLKLADLDGDGNDDLLAWSCQQGIAIQLSDGAGGLGAVRLLPAEAPVDVAVGDLDGDGIVDVAIARAQLDPLLYRGLGSGNFADAVPGPPVSPSSDAIVAADLDDDGRLDLAVAGESSCGEDGCTPVLSLLHGNGDFTFQPRQVVDLATGGGSRVAAMVVAQLNADGRPDLLTANPENRNMTVVRSLPSGEYQRFSVPTFGATAAVAAADFNRDGRQDLIAAAGDSGLELAFGNAGEAYDLPIDVPVTGTDLRGVVVVHVDDDGFEDLLAIDHASDQVLVLRGRGDGTFEEVQQIGVGSGPAFLAAGDLDGDGRPDFGVRGEGLEIPGLGPVTLRSLGIVRHH